MSTALVQVNDFFGRCSLIATGANRTIETNAIAEVGESRLRASAHDVENKKTVGTFPDACL